MLFGLIGDGSDAVNNYTANTGAFDDALASASKWGMISEGLSDTGKLRTAEAEKLKAQQAKTLAAQNKSNLATSSSLNNMMGGNGIVQQALERNAEVDAGNMEGQNADVFSRIAAGIEASDYQTQDDRARDVAVNVNPNIELQKSDILNKVAMSKSQGAAADNAQSKKLASTVGAVAGSAFGPLGTMAGGMLGGLLG